MSLNRPHRVKHCSLEDIRLIGVVNHCAVIFIRSLFFQTELVEQAKIENLIICLPTGSGKTYIAVMLIKELANAVRSSLKNGGKRTIFLVKTGRFRQK